MKQLLTQYGGLKREIYILFVGKLVTATALYLRELSVRGRKSRGPEGSPAVHERLRIPLNLFLSEIPVIYSAFFSRDKKEGLFFLLVLLSEAFRKNKV